MKGRGSRFCSRRRATRLSLEVVIVASLLLQGALISCETDILIELNEHKTDTERECADFLLTGRLGEVIGPAPPQCQNYVKSYLEDADHGHKVNIDRECRSFLLNAELNNIQGWLPPPRCENFIKSYMEDGQYEADVQVTLSAARAFLRTFVVAEGVDAVVFDVDETALSNMPYYRRHRYGNEIFQKHLFDEYVSESKQPALMAALSLYEELHTDGWAIIFITGRDEPARVYTDKNLRDSGYEKYAELVLRRPEEAHYSAVEYKSRRRVELETNGYRIRSTIGDQWSDLQGLSAGSRTFKLPNPMYYIF